MSHQGLSSNLVYKTAAITVTCLALLSVTALAAPSMDAGRPGQGEPLALAFAAPTTPRSSDDTLLADRLRRQIVRYRTKEATGTIIIDTPKTYLYYVLGGGQAVRYGIGVGRAGFTWSGVKTVARMSEWPDWLPPADMIKRQPYLPRWMAGGPHNPLGARAIYLSGTLYRIHGTNAPSTIGKHVSSGCIRMLNEDVIDLYGRVRVGTKVVVLPMVKIRNDAIDTDDRYNGPQNEASNGLNAFRLY
jgi:lipoprotein-anchoring transpeptidase ErfK/SrfK